MDSAKDYFMRLMVYEQWPLVATLSVGFHASLGGKRWHGLTC
jgi:hypothetical protein